MTVFSGTFNADGQISNHITLSPGQSISYSFTTAGLTGSVVVEKTNSIGAGFSKNVATHTGAASGAYKNESQKDEYIRLRCVELDDDPGSETVSWSLMDVDDEVVEEFINDSTGLYEMRFTDSGAEFRRQIKVADAPTEDDHVVRKDYVDSLLDGLTWKDPVVCATTANGALATAFANGQSIDGVTLSTGDRILIKDQSTGSENGIYVVNASGAPSRASDASTGAELINAAVKVQEGSTNEGKEYLCTNDLITIDSTSIVFVDVSTRITHNSLTGLQGGSAGEYYHLTSAQHSVLTSWINGSDGLTIPNADRIETDEVRARDSGGLQLNANSGSPGIFIQDNGNVRIGDVSSSDCAITAGINGQNLQARFGNLVAGIFPIVRWQGKNTGNTSNAYGDIKLDSDNLRFIFLAPSSSGPSTEALRINSSGQVGILKDASESLDVSGSVNASTSFKVGGTQVLSGQMATVGDPSGGSTIDSECRTQFNLLIDRLQSVDLMA